MASSKWNVLVVHTCVRSCGPQAPQRMPDPIASKNMMQPAPPAAKRLRGKTNCQVPLAEIDDWEAQEDPAARRSAWLITLPHPQSATSAGGLPLRAPETFTKRELFEVLHDCCQRPDYVDPKSLKLSCATGLQKAGVFFELHEPDAQGRVHKHAHLTALTASHIRFLPLKRAMLKRHGLASHWQALEGYWMAFRYCWMPSPKKPLVSLDRFPFLWACGQRMDPMGPVVSLHPDPHESCNEPMTASAIRSRRRYAEERAAEEGKQEPKLKELDIYGLVVAQGFRNTADDRSAHKQLIVYGMDHGSKALQEFLWKQRAQLSSLIDDIWLWNDMKETLARERLSRMEALKAASVGTCVCQGRWLAAVVNSFITNAVDIKALCEDVYALLEKGRSPDTPVLDLAGRFGGEGKSLFLKALIALFGDEQVFASPVPGNYPLLGLLNSKVCFFVEWRFDTDVIPWSVQCLLYDGSSVTVNRPQNFKGQTGHAKYTGSSPVFVTTKLADVLRLEKWAAVDPKTGAPFDADASMIFRRLKVHAFRNRIPKPPKGLQLCARCFAELVINQGSGM